MAAGLLAPMAANAFTIKDASGSVIYDSNKTNVIEDINENATELSIVLGDNEVFPSGNLPRLFTKYTQSDWGDRYELKDAPKIFRQFFTKLKKLTITGNGNIGGVIKTDAFSDMKSLETVVVEKASKIETRTFSQDTNIKDVYVNSDRKINCAHKAFDFMTTDGQTSVANLKNAAALHVTTLPENLDHYLGNTPLVLDEADHDALLYNRKRAENVDNGWWDFVNVSKATETQTIIDDDDVAKDALRTWSSTTTTMIPSYMSVFVVETDGKAYSLKRAKLEKVTNGDEYHDYHVLPPMKAVILFNQKNAVIKLYRADEKGVSLPYALDDIPVVGFENNQLIPMCDKDGVQLYTSGTRNGVAYSTYFFGNSENTTRAQYFKETYGNNKSFYGFFKAKNYVCHKNNVAYMEVPTSINANQYLGFVSLDCQLKADALAENFHGKDGSILFGAWDDESETTGISDVETAVKADNNFYTLTGVKVANPSKGIFIHNGKKVVIK